MPEILQNFFSYSQFIPHGHCYLWKPDLVWLHVVSDALIALAYFSIPILLIVLIRKRRDLPFHNIFWLFGAFIVACGTTHVMEIITLWYPIYWVTGVIKSVTAGVSILTALELAPLIPKVLSLPSPAQLEAANEELKQQIQERERAEANLREQESTLRSFYNSSPLMMGVVELLEDDILHRSDNRATASLFNATPEALQNRRASELGTPQDYIQTWLTYYRRSAQINAPVRFEYAHENAESDRWFSVTVCPIHQDANASSATRFAYVIEDVTDRKQAEADLQALNRDLEQRVQERTAELQSTNTMLLTEIAERKRTEKALEEANRLKDDFLAIVSHELRTPLNSILGWASLLRSRKFDAIKTEQALETIERNAKAQAQLIEDLLDISRLMRGKIKLNQRPIDLRSMLENSLQVVRPTAETQGIRLIQTIVTPAMVNGDLERLQQVMWNLLSNAVKFTPENGEVEVTLDVVTPERNGSEPSPMAQITVRDTGKGIRADFLPFVFERFRQADSSITREQGGLGLGLAIVRQLVELHKGHVSVTSPGEGQGATFTIQLPLLSSSESVPLCPNSVKHPSSASLSGLKILVVDDEPDARFLMMTVLKQAEAIVVTAESVQDAIALIDGFQPDLLISDIGMPNEDGYSFIRRIRQSETQKHLPAIALTAFASSSDRSAAIAAGFDQHVTKPCDPEELTAIVAQLCKR